MASVFEVSTNCIRLIELSFLSVSRFVPRGLCLSYFGSKRESRAEHQQIFGTPPNDIKHVVLQFSSALVSSIPVTPALLATVGVQCSSGTLLSALGRIMASLTLDRVPIRVSPTHQHIEIRVGPRNVQAPSRSSATVAVLVGG